MLLGGSNSASFTHALCPHANLPRTVYEEVWSRSTHRLSPDSQLDVSTAVWRRVLYSLMLALKASHVARGRRVCCYARLLLSRRFRITWGAVLRVSTRVEVNARAGR